MTDTPLSAFGTNALIAELRERGDLGLVRPEGGEQKRPATSSGGRPSGPSESRQEQDLATDVPAPGLPAPDYEQIEDALYVLDGGRGDQQLAVGLKALARLRADNAHLKHQAKLQQTRARAAEAANERLRRIEDAARQFTTWGYGSDAPDDCKRDFQLLLDALAVAPEGATE